MDAKDKNGNTPLQFLSARTPLSAIKVLDKLGKARKDGEKDVSYVDSINGQLIYVHVLPRPYCHNSIIHGRDYKYRLDGIYCT